MSSLRAVRYRKLALASNNRADADLLLKLADECDRFARLNGFRRGHTPTRGLSGPDQGPTLKPEANNIAQDRRQPTHLSLQQR